MPWYVWGRLWVGGWGGRLGVGESATSHTGSNLQNKCAERKEGKAKGLKSGEVAFEQALVPYLALAYTHKMLPLREEIIKIPPLEARCLLFATLRLVQTSFPCRKDCWQSRGAGDRDVFFRTKIKFLGSLGRVCITNLANDIQCCTGKLIYHADLCLPISHCAQMIQQKVSSRIKRTHKIFQAPGK